MFTAEQCYERFCCAISAVSLETIEYASVYADIEILQVPSYCIAAVKPGVSPLITAPFRSFAMKPDKLKSAATGV